MNDKRLLHTPLWLNLYGVACLALFGVGITVALIGSPADKQQGELIRIMYAHVSVAWICFLAVLLLGIFAMIFLWRGGKMMDIMAIVTAEMALFYSGLTLVGGMIYSKPTIGVFWTWDPKLTLTAIMFLLLVGYFVTRALIQDPMQRGRVSSVIAILVLVSLPFNWFAAVFWRTAHPAKSFEVSAEGIEDSMNPAMRHVLLYNVVVAALILGYFMIRRARLGQLEARLNAAEAIPSTSIDSKAEVIHV